jgi:hypothetical protein
MPMEALHPVLMLPMPLSNVLQTIPHEKLIVGSCEDGGRHIDQDGYPAVIHVAESLAAEKDGRHNPGAEVSGQVGGDGVCGETPDHVGIGEADGVWGSSWGDEGVSWVQACPNDDADEAIDAELEHEEVS